MRFTVYLGPSCQLQPMMVWGAKDITNLCTNFSHRKTLRFNQKGGYSHGFSESWKINIITYSVILYRRIPHEMYCKINLFL
jgi:hypothetical protein